MHNKKTAVGFLSAPNWFDPAPHEFPSAVFEDVVTQQAPLILPDFDYSLSSIQKVQEQLNSNAQCLKSMGCDVIAQVGSPFSWAMAASENDARARCVEMSQCAEIPVVMTGLAIVDALRASGAKKVAVNCTYYDTEWKEGFGSFLSMCAFQLTHISTLSEQGLGIQIDSMHDYGWSMNDDLTMKSILSVANMDTDADAIVLTGAGTRTLNIIEQAERETGKLLVAADTAVYWAIAKAMNLTLRPTMGKLASIEAHPARGAQWNDSL